MKFNKKNIKILNFLLTECLEKNKKINFKTPNCLLSYCETVIDWYEDKIKRKNGNFTFYKVYNILFDQDFESKPDNLLIMVPQEKIEKNELEDFLCDEISNITGHTHEGYEYKKTILTNT